MKQKQEGSNYITEGVIWKQILKFFLPLLLGIFFQQLYNTTDAVVVGRFVGKEALSAVGGSTGTLINLFVGFFVGISSGATVIISQYFGAQDNENVSKAVHTAIAFAIAGGAVIMLIGLIVAPYALDWMDTRDDVMPYALTYIRIYFGGMIANLVYNMGAGILRAVGDSKRPFYYLIISTGINIVLDLLFVTAFHWDVMGVAVATVISQVVSAVLVCITLIRTTQSYHLDLKQIRFHGYILKKIIRIGLPAGLQSVMYGVSNILIQSSINGFGTNIVAAWSAYGKIDGLFWMTSNSFGIAVTTFVGQNFGAGKYDRVRKGVRECLVILTIISVSLSAVLYYGGSYIFLLFTPDQIVIQKGMEILHYLVPSFWTYVGVEIFSGSLRGMGNSFIPMIITCFGVCVLRVVWIISAVPVWHTVKTLLFCYPLTWSVTSIVFVIYYIYYTKKNRHILCA